jgi:NCS1 family nucleobase:cation symporter-1
MVLKTTKERALYWATKLECPVDDNANYENTYVCTTDLSDVTELDADKTIAVV